MSEKNKKKYERQRWWESHKDKVIAYTIMIGLVVFFIIYLIVAYIKGWNLRFN